MTVEFWFKMDLTKQQEGHVFSLTLDNKATEEEIENLVNESLQGKFSSNWRQPVRRAAKKEQKP
jgi:hypothetical protein